MSDDYVYSSKVKGLASRSRASCCPVIDTRLAGQYSDVFTAGECEQHQHVEEEEFHNVHNHPGQGDLQGSEVGVHGEYVDEFQRAGSTHEQDFRPSVQLRVRG